MRPDADPQEVSREDVVRQRFNGQLGRIVSPSEYDIVWIGPYAYRSECVDQLRHGRVFFVGDAAHVVSPFDARSGNSGVQDADNLAWKLAGVVQSRASAMLLDSDHEERNAAATQNVLITHRTARFLRPADGMERIFRSAAISLAKRHVFARQLVNTGRMSTPKTYSKSSVCGPAGRRALQNVLLRWADGSAGGLVDLLRWAQGRLLLLVFGTLTVQMRSQVWQSMTQTDLRCVQVVHQPNLANAVEHVIDPAGHSSGYVDNAAWALVRPDSYVAATGDRFDAALTQASLAATGATT